MKILIVGGSGLIGGDAALHLTQQGHEVTIMARNPPQTPVLAALPFLQGNYIHDNTQKLGLENFDALVFSAAADIRNLPLDGSVSAQDFYQQVNDIAVPAFFKAAKEAGISKAVYIGSFYPQIAPQKIGECAYVTSRHNTDIAVRKLADEHFNVCTLNAPFVLGHIPGLEIPHIRALVEYAKGNLTELPVFAPKGGSNHISSRSLAQAIEHALQRGQNAKAYLIGDENLSWQDYLQQWFKAADNAQELSVSADNHPMLPNVIMYAGAGASVSYDVSDADMQVLDYDTHQISALIKKVVAAYN
ncbi:MAG: NAD(P)-dependent oxidoreductase [Pseudomonadales bacterium]|nr:NAD(P)-dependent oxidoreductase [Pseudomonadales bacterium]